MPSYHDDVSENFEPTPRDLENQIGRNRVYMFELDLARQNVLNISKYWYLSSAVCALFAIGLVFILFAQIKQMEWVIIASYTGQTILTTLLALIVLTCMLSFVRFVALRRLAGEALEVVEFTRNEVDSAQEFLAKFG